MAVILFAALPLRAQDSAVKQTIGITWGAEADFNYRYIWQGIAYSRGPVLQPSVWVTAKGLTVDFWANQALNNETRRGKISDYSVSLDYVRKMHGWTIEPEFDKWVNVSSNSLTGPNTSVVSVRIARAIGPVVVFAAPTLDIESYAGAWWGDAGISWERKRGRMTVASSASAGWASGRFNQAYIGPAKNAFNLVSAGLTLTISLPAHAYVRPHVEFSSIVDSELRRSLPSPTLWNAGLALGFSF